MIAPGTKVGKYEVRRMLGQGGFGMVFVGHDTALDRDIALKFLLPEHTSRPEILQRFLKEARSAAKIKHGGIVTVFECGVVEGAGAAFDGMAYIAMELLEGQSLAQRLEKGMLPLDHVLDIARQVASALAAAHAAGIVHRDLKPDNIFLVPDPATTLGERVKVLDFGIAKLADDLGGSAHKTSTHMIFGTPKYMSPEQCKSTAKVDERSDIYALGCIMFEMACGRAPFEGDAGELIGLHQFRDAPAPRTLRPDLPAPLEATIVSMLAKSAADRPQTMTDVVARLGGRPSAATPTPVASHAPEVAPTVPPTIAPAITPPAITPPAIIPSTSSSAPAVPAITVPPTRSRAPLAIVGGLVVIGGITALILTRGSGSPKTTDAGVVIDAAVASHDTTVVDETAVVAVADQAIAIDAALAPDAPAVATVDCKRFVATRNWVELASCAKTVSDPALAKQYDDRATHEAAAEVATRDLKAAIASADLKTAAAKLATIPATSVYRKEAKAAYDAAEQKASTEHVATSKPSTGISQIAAGVVFKTGSAAFGPAASGRLDQVVAALKNFSDARLQIEVHSDNAGDDGANKRLTQQRADAIRSYLISRGIDESRLTAVGYGADKPIAPNTTEDGRAHNRRIEFTLR